MNTSVVSDIKTANTCSDVAFRRAEIVSNMNVSYVLELCVGPSLELLEKAYEKYKIRVTGNDIEERWARYYPKGRWVIGDCLKISYMEYDLIVFAPPLSRGCSGHRHDSLMIKDIKPSYYDFINIAAIGDIKNIMLVLPARSIKTRQDRTQYYKLLNYITNLNLFSYKIVEQKTIKRNVLKYVEIYLTRL